MKELKSIFGLLVLLVGGYVMYMVFPVYWSDFKLGRMTEEQAQFYTYNPKSDKEISAIIAEKALQAGVQIVPAQVRVDRGAGELSIIVEYTVHVDLPIYPLDLNFTNSTHNKNVMK